MRKTKNLLDAPHWKWAKHYVKNDKNFHRMFRQMMAQKIRKGIKYQFGFRCPRSIKEAYELDALNGNTLWTDAIKKEVNLLYETYKCFKVLDHGEVVPEDYQQIPLIWTFVVKHYGRHRARCVAGG